MDLLQVAGIGQEDKSRKISESGYELSVLGQTYSCKIVFELFGYEYKHP